MSAISWNQTLRSSALYALFIASLVATVLVSLSCTLAGFGRIEQLKQQSTEVLLPPLANQEGDLYEEEADPIPDFMALRQQEVEVRMQIIKAATCTVLALGILLLAGAVYPTGEGSKTIMQGLGAFCLVAGAILGMRSYGPQVLPYAQQVWTWFHLVGTGEHYRGLRTVVVLGSVSFALVIDLCRRLLMGATR